MIKKADIQCCKNYGNYPDKENKIMIVFYMESNFLDVASGIHFKEL